jgi:hypothetical protein
LSVAEDDPYGDTVERPLDISLDLDRAEAEIQQRWVVWTAAGLTVQPVTRTGPDTATLRLRVARPNASADIVLVVDGSCETAVRRPDAAATIHETVQVDSVEAFGELVDRVVELITWSGVPEAIGEEPTPPPAQASASWVLSHDGVPLPTER